MIFKHKFVEYIPNTIEENIIYISISYSTAIHLCACGCGKEVVTPLSPTDWEITFNGKSVSIYPSIGNWNFECKSHYWIKKNEIILAEKWSDKEIKTNREFDKKAKEDFYSVTKQTFESNYFDIKPKVLSRWFLLFKFYNNFVQSMIGLKKSK